VEQWNDKRRNVRRRPPAVALLLVAGVRVVRLAVGVRVVCFVLVAREQVAVGEDRLDLVGWSLLVLLVVDRDRGDANALGRQLAVVGLREGVERERDRLVGREALLVLLLQIVAEVAPVGADRERLPLVGRAGRVGLEQARLAVLDPADDQRDAEGARAADLRVLLDVVGDVLGERLDTDRLAVAQAVDLRLSAGEVDQLAGVGDVARARDADVVVGLVGFSILSGSISGDRARLSAARTTPSSARTPTLAVPRFTASRAYSTW